MTNLNHSDEIWKDIQGYEGMYQASSQGRIKSIRFGKERVLKPGTDTHGYNYVYLKSKILRVHRIVALTFIPNSFDKPVINHIDNIRNNNCIENLEWVTSAENMAHAVNQGRKSPGNGTHRKIIQHDLHGLPIAEYESVRAARAAGFSRVSDCLGGKIPSFKGYTFNYAT